MNTSLLIQLLVNGVIVGMLYGIVAMCFVLIYKSTQVVNFAQGEFVVLGAWVCLALVVNMGLPFWLAFLFFWFFQYSRWGLAMRATAYNQQIAQSLGISVGRVFAMAWAISAVVSGIAGVVIGLVSAVSNSLAIIGIKVFPAVIVGGLDSIVGAIIGGLTIGILENLAEFVDGQYLHIGNMYSVAPFYVLLIILMIKPYGLLGTPDIERV